MNMVSETPFWFAFYYCNKYYDHKQSGEGMVYLAYISKSQSIIERNLAGTQGRPLDPGTDGGMLLTGLLLGGLLSLLSLPPAQGLPCPQWDGPSHVNHFSRKSSTGLLTGQS